MSGQTIALSWFLILLAIGAIIFLSVIIVVKRSISRRKGRIGKIIYTPCGHGAPNIWKDLVHKKINATVEVRTEPRVLGPMSSDGLCSNPTNQVLGFRFRAKTVDLFVDLKESILLSFPDLEAPPIRNIRDFLMAARMKAMHPTAPRDIVDSYCKLYMRARHDPGVRLLIPQ
uniref:NICE-3 protein n=1 Tax=Schistocephalus solidus TaxID=70667 RepID=A0A0X3PLQ2_SCHSO